MRTHSLLAIAIASLFGCGNNGGLPSGGDASSQANPDLTMPSTMGVGSTVVIDGTTLTPKSAAWANIAPGSGPMGAAAFVSDVSGLCSALGSIDTCHDNAGPPAGNYLVFLLPVSAAVGVYQIGTSSGTAQVVFAVSMGGSMANTDTAVAGTVTVDDIQPDGTLDAHYAITSSQKGATFTGNFSAASCPVIGALFGSSNTTCSASGGNPVACSASCSCGGKTTSSVSCTRANTSTAWTCTCTGMMGTSTCLAPVTTSGCAGGCCPGF